MEGSRFDELARALARPRSRRAVIATLAGGLLGALGARSGSAAPASAAVAFNPASVVFSDDFESGTLRKWTQVSGVVIEQSDVAHGRYAARAASTGGAAFAQVTLSKTWPALFARVRFRIQQRGGGVTLLQFFTAGGSSLVSVYLTDQGDLGFRDDVAGQDARSTTSASASGWHELQVRVRVGTTGNHVEVWLDGRDVKALNQAPRLGTTPIGRFQIGDSATGDTFAVLFDDVVLATEYIPSAFGVTGANGAAAGQTGGAPGPVATGAAATTAPATATPPPPPPSQNPRPTESTTGCGTGQTVCNSGGSAICVDLTSDSRNCGACGTVCGAGNTCANGTCVGGGQGGACPGGCATGQACCTGSCVDLGNESNCTACGDTCAQNTVCCSTSIGCVDLSSDPNHCGLCGNACAQGQTCANGTCTGGTGGTGCLAGQANCGNGCVNLGDESNCSACGDTCAGTQVCCGPATGCVDVSSDPNNCGSCGNSCGQGGTCSNEVCIGGAGGTTCPGGQADCGNGCVQLGDETNCTACGDACGAGEVCCSSTAGCHATC